MLAALLVMFATGWISVSTLLYFHFKYRKDFDTVTYTNMLMLPLRLNEHRTEMGNYHVEKGMKYLKEGNARDGIRLLRLGVARAKDNMEGRLAVAEIFELWLRRPDKASEMLLGGMEYGGNEDPDYLKRTLSLLLRHQMDKQIQELADNYLPDEPEITQLNQIIAFGAANANYLRGNYDRADDYLIGYKLLDTPEGILLSANISWDRGNQYAATTKLEQSLNKFPNAESILMQLSRYHREMGDLDQARRYAILRNVAAPMSAAPRLELLYIYNLSGDEEREQRETKRMLKQFRKDVTALQSLANFAADTGNIELARRTYEEALENEFPIDSFALLLIEAHLVDADYAGAISFAEELIKEKPDWLNQRKPIFESLRAVASFGINRPDLGEIYLQAFLDGSNVQPASFLAVARRFNNIERPQQARKVLMAAYQLEPSNQKVLSELIRVELSLGNTENLNQLLTRFLQMRRPEMNLLAEAYRKLGSDRFIFTPDRETLLLELNSILQENRAPLEEGAS
ncbi:tetratricopeptide repeat protein [Coraliomargarita akajimensis]|nr:hypothetical protein [Coraliomargarita akajimensis]